MRLRPMIEPRRTLKSSLVLVALLAGLLALPSQSVAGKQERKNCSTLTQAITDRVGVSCKKAKRIRSKASRALGGLPECSSQPTEAYRSWEISGGGEHGSIIATVFISGNRSFIVSGGGAC